MAHGDPKSELVALESKVRQFIDDESSTPEFVREVLWRLFDRLGELQKSAKRDYSLIVLAVLAFELLNRNLIGEATAAGVKLAKLDFLRFAIPVAVAYLFLRFIATAAERSLVENMYYLVAHSTFRGFERSALAFVLKTTSAQVFNVPPRALLKPASHSMTVFLERVEAALAGIVLPIGFSVYALVQLFRGSEPPYVGAYVSTGLTALLLTGAYLYGLNYKTIPETASDVARGVSEASWITS